MCYFLFLAQLGLQYLLQMIVIANVQSFVHFLVSYQYIRVTVYLTGLFDLALQVIYWLICLSFLYELVQCLLWVLIQLSLIESGRSFFFFASFLPQFPLLLFKLLKQFLSIQSTFSHSSREYGLACKYFRFLIAHRDKAISWSWIEGPAVLIPSQLSGGFLAVQDLLWYWLFELFVIYQVLNLDYAVYGIVLIFAIQVSAPLSICPRFMIPAVLIIRLIHLKSAVISIPQLIIPQTAR